MDRTIRNKLWAGFLALSIILGSSVLSPVPGSAANIDNLGAARSLAIPTKENKRRFFPIIDEAAVILGLQTERIKQALGNGKSLLDLAKEQGLSEADFTDRLLAMRLAKVDEAVKAGKITPDNAIQIKAKMREHITFMIRSNRLLELHSKEQREAKQLMSPEKLAAIIGISEDKLVEQLKAGKSITEIAAANGLSKPELVAKIKDNMTPFLEKAVDHKAK